MKVVDWTDKLGENPSDEHPAIKNKVPNYPWFYNRDKDELHLGPEDWYHVNFTEAMKKPYGYFDMSGRAPGADMHGKIEPRKKIYEALKNHLNLNDSAWDEDWKFSKVAAEWAGDPENADPKEKGLYPVVYDGEKLLVGYEGLHHKDVDPNAWGQYIGIVALGDHKGAWTPNSIEWLGTIPENHEQLQKELSGHFGQPIEQSQPQKNRWNFSATLKAVTPPDCRPWAAGEHGRYIVDKDGIVYSWIANDATHEQIIAEMGSPDSVVDGGYITPEGKKQPWGGGLDQNWVFGKLASVINGNFDFRSEYAEVEIQTTEPWELGREGKYIVDGSRQILWAIDGNDEPHHGAVVDGFEDIEFGGIKPDGTVESYSDDERADLILSAHPDLKLPVGEGKWTFGKVTKKLTSLQEYTASAKVPPIADYSGFDGQHYHGPGYGQKIWEALNIGWTPGKEGKGIFINKKELYTWNTFNDEGDPHHDEVIDILEEAGIGVYEGYSLDSIDPEGYFSSWRNNLEVEREVQSQDPRLKPAGDGFDSWTSKLNTEADILKLVSQGWRPGQYGKRIEATDGRIYDWATTDGSPHHIEVEQSIPGMTAKRRFDIMKNGEAIDWETLGRDREFELDGWEY